MTIRPIADKTWLPEDCKEIIASVEGPLTQGSFDDIDARVVAVIPL